MKNFVVFNARRDESKDLIREKQPFIEASQDENIFYIAPGNNSSIFDCL
ncbi:hypothetical protein [Okeania sp. SIO1I7]|nr:hypothetical protein [Okeania sp. SIO1I7]NET25941.1 hypothetical protein [Okeania sp. SIO1I7]